MLFRVEFEDDQTAMHNVGVLKAGLRADRVSYSLGFGGGNAVVTVTVDSADELAQFSDLKFERDPDELAAEAQALADAAASTNVDSSANSGKKASKSE